MPQPSQAELVARAFQSQVARNPGAARIPYAAKQRSASPRGWATLGLSIHRPPRFLKRPVLNVQSMLSALTYPLWDGK